MKKIRGDLIKLALDGEFDLIVHGCNCFHTMGAGIAKSIAAQFPEAYEADKATPYGERAKLGTISSANIEREQSKFVVANAYTQFQWRGRGRKADYDAIAACFDLIAERHQELRIGYPMIGAGLAGGDWSVIEPLISGAMSGLDHTLVLFDG